MAAKRDFAGEVPLFWHVAQKPEANAVAMESATRSAAEGYAHIKQKTLWHSIRLLIIIADYGLQSFY